MVASLCATTEARADAVGDFSTGTVLYLRSGTTWMDDYIRTSGGITLGKPANTLTFSVPASQFGMTWPMSLTFAPVSYTGSTIHYSVSEQATGPVDVDGHGHMLTSVTGYVDVTLTPVPGNQATVGNVALQVTQQTIVAHGSWGDMAIAVQGELIGGSLPSRLKSFSTDAGDPQCSDYYPSDVYLFVSLEHPASSAGQSVTLTSTDPAITVTQGVHIAPGASFATAYAVIPANYVGTTRLGASANGAVSHIDLQIHPKSDCPKHKGPPVAINWNPECPQCNAFVNMTDHGEILATATRSPEIFTQTQLVDLLASFKSYAPTAITAAHLSSAGFVTGTVTIRGATHGYLANYRSEPGVLHLFDTMTPTSVNAYGLVVGSSPDPASGQPHAAYSLGTGVVMLKLPFAASSSKATLVTDSGELIGTFTPAGGVAQGFRERPSGTFALPIVGKTAAVAVAANAAGDIAANGTDGQGKAVAAIIDSSNRVTLTGSPAGYSGFTLRSINKYGSAVGVATSVTGSGQRAFLWTADKGFTALTGYTKSLTLADDVLQIDDSNNVLVHGVSSGATNLFILSL